jgi:Rod binding domain-containing protein
MSNSYPGWKLKTNSINTLPIHKKINMEKVPKAYKQVAEGMETQFINHMLTEMEKSVKSKKPDSSSVSYYKSLMNYERAKTMATTNDGVGIKEMILKDLLPPHLLKRATATPNKEMIKSYKNQGQAVAIQQIDQGDQK